MRLGWLFSVALVLALWAGRAGAVILGTATLSVDGSGSWDPGTGVITVSSGTFSFANALPLGLADYTVSADLDVGGLPIAAASESLGSFALADELTKDPLASLIATLTAAPSADSGSIDILGFTFSGSYDSGSGISFSAGSGIFSGTLADNASGDIAGLIGSTPLSGDFSLDVTVTAETAVVPLAPAGLFLAGGFGFLALFRRRGQRRA